MRHDQPPPAVKSGQISEIARMPGGSAGENDDGRKVQASSRKAFTVMQWCSIESRVARHRVSLVKTCLDAADGAALPGILTTPRTCESGTDPPWLRRIPG
ncbi:hypothetical protein Raf01_92540 [Rugosimonospora africana]|uniref:Uncharacterized protein n=1 Tax=Rugosimonospora africana TaxID=556532 RepID=A0A8J3R3A7_9ACTN|nr:hypothetical protein Raf01_92540 [Rugosimonospora africana]